MSESITLTYRPREGDPAFVKWGGKTFRAGEPTETSHPEVVKSAPNNPWFEVSGESADAKAKKIAERSASPGWDKRKKPRTSDDYRAYSIAWINEAAPDEEDTDFERSAKNCIAAMRQRWADEAEMRDACGVGTDDIEYIDKIYAPKLSKLGGR